MFSKSRNVPLLPSNLKSNMESKNLPSFVI
jgi:hypothetical protein